MELLLQFISSAENINSLKSYDEIRNFIDENNLDIELCNEWADLEFTIKDGTEIETDMKECFNSRNGFLECDLYKVKDTNIYICADCGLILKSYEKLVDKIAAEYDNYYNTKYLFPISWNQHGVECYVRKYYEKKPEVRRTFQYDNIFKDCTNCKNMIKSQCIFGNEEFTEDCEDWQER